MTTTAGPTSEIPQVRLKDSAGIAPATTPVAAPETPAVTTTKVDRKAKSKAKTQPDTAPSVTPGRGRGKRTTPAPKAKARPKGLVVSAALTIGGMPRVDLLPQSIRVLDRQKRSRRTMRIAAVGIAIVVAAGTGAAWYLNTTAQQELAEAQANSESLLAQQAQYSDLVNLDKQIDLATAAQAVGGSTDADWRNYLTALQATLPAGVVLKAVTIDSAAPGTSYEQSTTPLEGARVATLTFTAISPSLPDVPTWLDGLRTLPAFVDATPNSVQLDATDGTYAVDITMHVSSAVYSNRFTTSETDGQ